MKYILGCMAGLLLLCFTTASHGQDNLFVNMAMLDGVGITPDNLMQFQVQSTMSKPTHALVSGTIRYRNSELRISYKFEYDLKPGINIMSTAKKPAVTYSSQALRDLFEQYRMLPQGIYEYCVTVTPNYNAGENIPGPDFQECIYHKSEDIFLINLIDPEDGAKLYEYNPMLSWTVNYPFASELKYRLRVAEIKEGQNNTVAVNRNNPIYDERNLMQMSQVYPVYAKPLKKDQPYAWTVDAYYKGILLGGAEPWRFTIIDDSLLVGIPKDPSFVDIKRETGSYSLYAPGVLKLKYNLEDLRTDSLSVELRDNDNKEVKLKDFQVLNAVYGDNRFVLDFKAVQPLNHLKAYTLLLHSQTGNVYKILFKYVNPELIK